LSSLEGDFYFLPGSGKPSIDKTETGVAKTLPADEFDDENSKLEEEQRSLEEERAAFARKKALDEKRQKIAEEKERLEVEKEAARQAELKRQQAKKTLAMAPRPSVSTAQEIRRDGMATLLPIATGRFWTQAQTSCGRRKTTAQALTGLMLKLIARITGAADIQTGGCRRRMNGRTFMTKTRKIVMVTMSPI